MQKDLDKKFGNLILERGDRKCDNSNSSHSFEEVESLDQGMALQSIVQTANEASKKVDHHVKKIVPIYTKEGSLQPTVNSKPPEPAGDYRTVDEYEHPHVMQKWVVDSVPAFPATVDAQHRFKEPSFGSWNATGHFIDDLPAKYIARKECHPSVFANVSAMHSVLCTTMSLLTSIINRFNIVLKI